MKPLRGSRKHILDWLDQQHFPDQLNDLVVTTGATIDISDSWKPKGHNVDQEPKLHSFGPKALPSLINWNELVDWWLVHKGGAMTPNWDLASTCTIEGNKGLILVEAKANVPELKTEGKLSAESPSVKSDENHERIAAAINQAKNALNKSIAGVNISRQSHYQLSNRVAYSWKLASFPPAAQT